VPNSKPETRYADTFISKVEEIKEKYSTSITSPEKFKCSLDQQIELTTRNIIKETITAINNQPDLGVDALYGNWVGTGQIEFIYGRNLSNMTGNGWDSTRNDFHTVSQQVAQLTDLTKVRARADRMDKLRFVGARFLSTIAIGAAALLMAFVGHEYLGFETALLKKIPQEVVNSPIVISDVISVYDGATFRVNIKGYPHIIGENMPIRVSGIDIPEIKAQCGYEKSLAVSSKYFTTKFLKGGTVELRNAERGKYFRITADVYVKGVSLGDSLIDAGLAHKYDKKEKKDWCK